jgi:hypothetical protein
MSWTQLVINNINYYKMKLNDQMVKLWITDQISKIQQKKDKGLILYISADAKIDILQDFYETFELDKVTFNLTYHDKI